MSQLDYDEDGVIPWSLEAGLIKSDRVIHPYSLRNLTKVTLDTLYPDVKDGKVSHRSCVISGNQESGKTTLLNYLAKYAISKYRLPNVNLIPVTAIKDGLDLIDSKLVQDLIMDDAVTAANSRTSGKNAESVADYYFIRHLFEQRANTQTGAVITTFASQRWKSLDIVFRNADVIIFKSSASDPQDKKLIQDLIGVKAYERLKYITTQIKLYNNDAIKSECIVCLPSAELVGSFKFPKVSPILQFYTPEGRPMDTRIFSFDVMAVLDELDKSHDWRRAAKAYRLSKYENINQAEIAEQLSTPKARLYQSDVSTMIRKISGRLSDAAGREYEAWKVKQLTARGFKVKPNGGTGMPDIIAYNLKGQELVYSCKCIDAQRKISLPLQEVRPELHQALRDKATLIVSIYNLADDTELELPYNPKQMPDSIVFSPEILS